MSAKDNKRIAAILAQAQDAAIATLREDGWPQVTVVSYVSDGPVLYFVCGDESQKARNLSRDGRVSVAATLPYDRWSEIGGLSMAGIAERVRDPRAIGKVRRLVEKKFPEASEMGGIPTEGVAVFRVTPQLVSILDYSQEFGHTELVDLRGKSRSPRGRKPRPALSKPRRSPRGGKGR